MERKQKYGLRKLSVGVVSCFLGSVVYFGTGMTVQAEEAEPGATQESTSDDVVAETTSTSAVIDESAPLSTNESEYAKEYDDYDVSESWSKDDTLDMSKSGGYYWKNQAHTTASTSITRDDGSVVEVVASIKGVEGTRSDATYFFNGNVMSEAKGEGQPYAGSATTLAGEIPALGVILYSPTQEHLGLTGKDYVNFDGQAPLAELTLTFSEEVTNPIMDLSGLGGYAAITQTYVRSFEQGKMVTNEEFNANRESYWRGSFMNTRLESLTEGVTFTQVTEGKNLTVENGIVHIIDEDSNNTGSVGNIQQLTVKPSGTGTVQLTGTFKEVKILMTGSFKPMSYYAEEGSAKRKENAGGVWDGINGWNYNTYEDITLGANSEIDPDDHVLVVYGPNNDIDNRQLDNERGGADEDTLRLIGRVPNADAFRFSIRLQKTGSVLIDYVDTEGNSIKDQVVDMPEGSILETPYDTQENDNEYPYEIKVGKKLYRLVRKEPTHVLRTQDFSTTSDSDFKVGKVADDGHLVETSMDWGTDDPKGVVEQGVKRITYVYREVKGDVIVHYIDEDGNTIKDDVEDTPSSSVGTQYDTTDNKPQIIEFEGKEYKFIRVDESSAQEQGEVVEGTTEVTYVYKLVKGDVIVHYVDEDGNTIKTDVVDTPLTPTGSEYDTTDNKPSRIVTEDGKTYDLVPSKTVGEETGKVKEGTTEVTYVYREVKGDVVVHYINEDGETIKGDVVDTPSTSTGTNYDTTDNKPKRITTEDGKVYELVPSKTIGQETGKVVEGTTHVTYVYREVKGDVLVHYVDEEGKTIKNDVIDTPLSSVGTSYDTTENKPTIINFEGKEYELVPTKTIGEETGKVVEGTTEVTYVYRLKKGDVIVHYVDEEGNTIKTDVVDTPLAPTGSEYDTTDNKPVKIITDEGKVYELVPTKTVGEETGKVIEGTTHVTYVYKLLKGDVIVHYVDESGNTIKEDIVDTPESPTGTDYDTTDNKPTIIEFNGQKYELIPTRTVGSEQGKVVEGTTHITYVYKLVVEEEKEIKGVERDIPRPPTELVPPVFEAPKPDPKPTPTTPLPTPVPTPEPKQPTPNPEPTPKQPPVQTGMESSVMPAFVGMITSFGAMVAMKKKDNE